MKSIGLRSTHPSARHRRSLIASVTSAFIIVGTLVGTPAITHAEPTANIESASLQWGLKESLNTYVLTGTPPGTVTPLGSNSSPAHWTQGTGNVDPVAKTASVAFGANNGVHYQGQPSPMTKEMAINFRFTNPRVEMGTATKGKLYLDVTGRALDFSSSEPGKSFSAPNTHFANITASEPTVEGRTTTWVKAKTVLTAQGAELFGRVYSEGEELDPLTLQVTVAETTAAQPVQKPTQEAAPDPATTITAKTEAAASTDDPASQAQKAPAHAAPAPLAITTNGASPKTEDACSSQAVTSGSLNWRIRKSFITYIEKSLVNGAHTGGNFTVIGGSIDNNKNGITGIIHTSGEFHATGHSGKLNLKVNDIDIKFNSTQTATMSAVITSTDIFGAPTLNSGKRVDIATLNVSGLTVSGNTLNATDAAATLTAAGTEAFAGYYAAGEKLDPVPISVTLGEKVACDSNPIPSSPANSEKQAKTGTTTRNSDIAPNVTADPLSLAAAVDMTKNARVPASISTETETETTKHLSAPAASPVPAVTPVTAPLVPAATGTSPKAEDACVARAVTSGSLNWLIRKSFITYLAKPFVKGAYTGGNFTVTGGSINNKNGITGIIRTSGEFHATGHDGKLNLKVSNIDIKFNGTQTATMSAVMTSTDISGAPTPNSGKRVDIVALNVSGLTVSGNTLNSSGAAATLTAAGTEAFAGFYATGEVLDPVPFSVTLGGDVACDSYSDPGSPANSGTLAKTGTTTHNSEIALIAFIVLLTGIGLTRAHQTKRGGARKEALPTHNQRLVSFPSQHQYVGLCAQASPQCRGPHILLLLPAHTLRSTPDPRYVCCQQQPCDSSWDRSSVTYQADSTLAYPYELLNRARSLLPRAASLYRILRKTEGSCYGRRHSCNVSL